MNFQNVQSQTWVTKILSDTLSDYTPDGGMVCKRHGLEYREGLKNLKLWATQSKFIVEINYLFIKFLRHKGIHYREYGYLIN